ncbi:DUF4142 domain-containing protein [Rhizobium sp. RU36D]|uniref:DUF4142 domain-containing protein n=1 Tax=Rhizobium sp. RU36D TaxID=1907415 RepID=UPI0009D83EAE|nr:DUF4142 domain-containing protein [Rhizobium sp. RU36D]SMC47520.1 Predicted outer membrane protein [Rhizobium sp. RU36D]
MKRLILLGIVAVLAHTPAGMAQQRDEAASGANVHDGAQKATELNAEQFTRRAAKASLFDIEAARLATVRARDPNTSVFAQQVLNDQLKAQADLKVAAEQEGLPLENKLDGRQQRELERLKQMEGEGFDKAFYSVQKKTQRATLTLLSEYGANGDRESLRAFAQSHYSTMKVNFARVQP